jgi:hypothetical protein
MPLKTAEDLESFHHYKKLLKKDLSQPIRAETPYVWLTACVLKDKTSPLFFLKPDKAAIADLMKANPKAKKLTGSCSRPEGDLLRLTDKKVPRALNKHLNSLKESDLFDIVFVPADAEDESSLNEAAIAAPAASAAQTQPNPPAAPPAVGASDPAVLGQRLNDLRAKFAKLSLRPETKGVIDKIFLLAESHRAKQNWPNLSQTLDAAESQLKKFTAANVPPSPPGPGPGPGQTAGAAKAQMESFRKQWDVAKQAWRDSMDTVNAQITRLQSALKSSGDDDLEEIAEFGLNGVTGNFKTPLMAALLNIDAAADAAALKKAASNAAGIIQGFRQHLDSDEAVEACDDNPFGVKVSIRETVGGGLSQLEEALKSTAA